LSHIAGWNILHFVEVSESKTTLERLDRVRLVWRCYWWQKLASSSAADAVWRWCFYGRAMMNAGQLTLCTSLLLLLYLHTRAQSGEWLW